MENIMKRQGWWTRSGSEIHTIEAMYLCTSTSCWLVSPGVFGSCCVPFSTKNHPLCHFFPHDLIATTHHLSFFSSPEPLHHNDSVVKPKKKKREKGHTIHLAQPKENRSGNSQPDPTHSINFDNTCYLTFYLIINTSVKSLVRHWARGATALFHRHHYRHHLGIFLSEVVCVRARVCGCFSFCLQAASPHPPSNPPRKKKERKTSKTTNPPIKVA